MEGSFRIPKKKQQGSSVIEMTSPLSRLQNDVTSTSHWAQERFNGKKQNGSGHVNGRRESDSYRWRPRRASDSLCQEDKHPPSAKKKWGSGLSETPKPEENEKESKKKVERETKGTIVHDSVVKQNGAEEERPEKRVKIPKGTSSSSVTVRKPAADLPSPRRKLRLSPKMHQRAKASSSEPIVLSSGDEDEGADAVPGANSQINRDPQKANQNLSSGGRLSSPAAILELPFSTLHFGATTTRANGPIMITVGTICIPLKGSAGQCVSVSLVPSELKAYAVWNRDGCKLMEQQGSSSSILFLSLTDAQARLLQMELSSLHNNRTTGSPCPFVLVLLIGRLGDTQRASLASLMEMMALRSGRQSLGTPLSWAEGVKRLLCHPRGSHLVKMLEHKEGTNQNGTRNSSAVPVPSTRQMSLRSHTRQQSLPRRLIQYPPPPSKGGITVTTEDLECLRDGEFLNDVIIDFYLKYLHLERTDRDVADRSHIFSSFFYKQLTRKDNPSEEEAGGTAQYRRHQRVRTWTKNVDIFSKDFVFIPVNQEAHWYLVVICFPGLLQPEHVQWRTSPADKDETKGTTKDGTSRAHELPDCTAFSCQKDTVTKRPCILIMDSLKLSCHYRIYTLLQEYLQVEWEVRRGTPRIFNGDSIQRSQCKVPLQDNSSDCGLYLLQYVESFLQNPVVHFDLPLRLERWFPRQQVRRKRAELRELVLQLYRRQGGGVGQSSS